MSGPDTNWRDRCEMFFSSMDKYADQDLKKNGKRGGHQKKSKPQVIDENTIQFPGWQPGFYEGNITTFSKKKQPFKGLIRWLSSVDIHGSRMLPRSRSHLFCVLWIIIIIIGCGLCGVGFYKFIIDYIDGDIEIKTGFVKDGSNASPLSLMMCNKNIVRKSKVDSPDSRFYGLDGLNATQIKNLGVIQTSGIQSVETVTANTKLVTFLRENQLVEVSSELLVELNKEYSSFCEMSNESDWENAARSLLSVDSIDLFPRAFRLTSSEFNDVGHKMDLSILECTKNGRKCDLSEISYVQNAEFGQCAVIHLSLGGSWFDVLTVTLDVQPEEYIDFVSPAPGIRAIVQSASSLSTSWLPILSSDFIVANPGAGLHLSISKTHELRRKSKNCNSDPNYNKLDCVSRCLVLHTASVCGCSISLPSLLSQRCRVHVQYEYLCQRLLRVLYQRNQLPCDCPNTCKEEFLDVTASSFDWIKNDSEALIRTSLDLADKTRNFSDIRSSVTKIQVSWSHSSYVKLEEEDKLSLIGLFLKLGSVSAITVGISVITIVEFLWLIGRAILYLCCAVNKNRKRHSDGIQQIYPVQHIYPEFDNINVDSNWYTSGVGGQSQGHGQGHDYTSPQPPIGLSNSPLNRRRINNYIISPTSNQADYNGNNTSAVPAQTEFIYRGRPRESGFVYGEISSGKEMSSPIRDADNSPNMQQKKTERNENKLFSKPWDRSGHHGVYSRILVPNPNAAENKEVPLFNSPYLIGDDERALPTTHNNNDNDQDIESEGNPFHHITKFMQNSDHSKTTGSGEQSKTESQRHADNDLKVEEHDKHDDGHGGREDNGNIFKISQAEMNDISWIPDDNTNTHGPDLSNFNTFLRTSTHKPQKVYTTSKEGQNIRNQHQKSSHRNFRDQRGFGRTTQKGEVGNATHDTTPMRGVSGVQRTRLLSPNTWHNYIVSSNNPLPPPPSGMAQPVSYVVYGPDGRDAIFRHQ